MGHGNPVPLPTSAVLTPYLLLYKECNRLAQKGGQFGLCDAAAQFGRGVPDAVDGADDVFHQLVGMIRATVGEFSFGE